MQRNFRIAILGMGGVGGFIGGKLAAAHQNKADVEILFLARGNNARALRSKGLTLKTSSGEMNVRPHAVMDNAAPDGIIDLLICCTKSYDLEVSIQALAPALTADTIVLPLLNGMDAAERIQTILPKATVLSGCIYIVSKLVAPGVVQQSGDFHSLHFGGDNIAPHRAQQLLDLFQQAGIHAVWEDAIREKVWAKFSFISPLATYTSAHNITIGQILESSVHSAALKKLMLELGMLAQKLKVHLADDFIEKNFLVMKQLPPTATSSMQADFANGRPTELETLTGVVVKKAAAEFLHLEAYPELYQRLGSRG